MMTFILWVIIILLLVSFFKKKKKDIVMGPPMKLLEEEFDISKKEHQEYLRYVIGLLKSGIDHRTIPNFGKYHHTSAGQFLYKNLFMDDQNNSHPVVVKLLKEFDDRKKKEKLITEFLKELEEEDKKSREEEIHNEAWEEAKRIFEAKKNS